MQSAEEFASRQSCVIESGVVTTGLKTNRWVSQSDHTTADSLRLSSLAQKHINFAQAAGLGRGISLWCAMGWSAGGTTCSAVIEKMSCVVRLGSRSINRQGRTGKRVAFG